MFKSIQQVTFQIVILKEMYSILPNLFFKKILDDYSGVKSILETEYENLRQLLDIFSPFSGPFRLDDPFELCVMFNEQWMN